MFHQFAQRSVNPPAEEQDVLRIGMAERCQMGELLSGGSLTFKTQGVIFKDRYLAKKHINRDTPVRGVFGSGEVGMIPGSHMLVNRAR